MTLAKSNNQDLKSIIDRPNLVGFNAFNKIFSELGPHLRDDEIEKILDFMFEIENSKFDINPSISDSITQIKIIIGSDRYDEVKEEWSKYNPEKIKQYGTIKYQCKKTNEIYDGLDDTDDPNDYKEIYI